jgi:hypothetical protein
MFANVRRSNLRRGTTYGEVGVPPGSDLTLGDNKHRQSTAVKELAYGHVFCSLAHLRTSHTLLRDGRCITYGRIPARYPRTGVTSRTGGSLTPTTRILRMIGPSFFITKAQEIIDLLITDLEHSTDSRITFNESQKNRDPLWSPDGSKVVFASSRVLTSRNFLTTGRSFLPLCWW